MGWQAFWDRLLVAGFKPEFVERISYLFDDLRRTDGVFRFDTQASFYSFLRSCYGFKSATNPEIGHAKVAAFLEDLLGNNDNNKNISVFYFDGNACFEKQLTSEKRHQEQQDALINADMLVTAIEKLSQQDQHISKTRFRKAFEKLSASFNLPIEIKKDLVQYLVDRGFKAKLCRFEADPEIAAECNPQDIVVTKDSDLFGYATVCSILKPISRGRYLMYNLQNVMRAMELNRTQLTLFAIVSTNDYDKSVPGLGPVKNHG
ncbi:hypothetical protein BGZ83_004246, partial [Gryganskiella cystojenkinii]